MVIRLNKIDTMLLRMIKKSKSQFAAVVMIIVVGICIFTAMSMTAVNMRHTVDAYYAENHFADLFILTGAVPAQEVTHLKKIDGVKQVTGRITTDVPMVTDDPNERVNIRLVTISPDPKALCQSTLIEGRKTNLSDKEVLLIQQFADARGCIPEIRSPYRSGGISMILRSPALLQARNIFISWKMRKVSCRMLTTSVFAMFPKNSRVWQQAFPEAIMSFFFPLIKMPIRIRSLTMREKNCIDTV